MDATIRLAEIAAHFARAAIDGTQWLPALQSLAELTGSSRGQLVGFGGPSGVPFNWINGFTQEEVDAFVAVERGDPNINVRVRASLHDPTFVIRSEADYRAVGPGPGYDLYREMCETVGIPNGCQTKLIETKGHFVGLAVHRTAAEGETTPEDRALFAAAAPGVHAAIQMQSAIEDRGLQLLAGSIDQLGLPVFICNGSGQVKARTELADDVLAGGGLRLRKGRLSAPREADDAKIQEALARHERSAIPALETLVIGGAPQRLPVILDIWRLPSEPFTASFGASIIVLVRSGRRWRESAPLILKSLYGLSAAEADVAIRVAGGESRETIAAARATRPETVKAQLKSIFTKLDVSREADLIVALRDLLG